MLCNKIGVFPIIAPPHEIIASPHYGINTMMGGAICYLTTKLGGGGGGGGYNGKDHKIERAPVI